MSNRTPTLLPVAACASIGAGAIHSSVIGAHGAHRALATLFVWVAAAQLVWGVAALVRPSRVLALIGSVLHIVVLVAWFVTRSTGLSWIGGLERRGRIGFPDAAAAGLALVVIGIGVGVVVLGAAAAEATTVPVTIAAFVVAAVSLPAMVIGGTRTPSVVSPAGAVVIERDQATTTTSDSVSP